MQQIDLSKRVHIQMHLTSIKYNFLLLKHVHSNHFDIILHMQNYIIAFAFEEMQHIDLPKPMQIQIDLC